MIHRFACALLVVCAGLGCASEPPPPPPRMLEPAPAGGARALSQDAVLEHAQTRTAPELTIEYLDRHPFDFSLNAQTLAEFERAGAAPEVLDYLHKRSRVDWASTRGDIDPSRSGVAPQKGQNAKTGGFPE